MFRGHLTNVHDCSFIHHCKGVVSYAYIYKKRYLLLAGTFSLFLLLEGQGAENVLQGREMFYFHYRKLHVTIFLLSCLI